MDPVAAVDTDPHFRLIRAVRAGVLAVLVVALLILVADFALYLRDGGTLRSFIAAHPPATGEPSIGIDYRIDGLVCRSEILVGRQVWTTQPGGLVGPIGYRVDVTGVVRFRSATAGEFIPDRFWAPTPITLDGIVTGPEQFICLL